MIRISFLLLIALFNLNLFAAKKSELLVEVESFTNKGGWLVDPQFVEQMGSPYLLAHGLGTPVANAATWLKFTQKGTFHVYARTRDWAKGSWVSPGRFSIIVDQKLLENELGNDSETWSWQYAGSVKITKDSVLVELKDLTGFDGRCDAIYFSTVKESPPNEAKQLATWRKKMHHEPDKPVLSAKFDLVITGGGIAGCAAAMAAAEQGMQVALLQDRPVLGGNSSSEIRVHTLGITWQADQILKQINTEHWPNGSPKAYDDDKKRHENIAQYTNIKIFLNWRAYNVEKEKDVIKAVFARNVTTGELQSFEAPLFVDCTGDGWIGYWAGAEYMYGREPVSKYGEAWEQHGELWSPEKADNRIMGSSVLWQSETATEPVSFPEVPWAMEVAGKHAAINGEWYWEYSSNDKNQIEDAEFIRDHILKGIYGSFYNARLNPENANVKLQWVSYLVGKRESRRLVGDYIYTFDDEKTMREFDDAVVMEKREVDVHYQQNLQDATKPVFLSEALYYHVDHYYIPYRSLYSKNIKNLFMAGRCFSCSHVGLGGPRVMNTTGQMGVAVGYAASLCKKHNTYPRQIYEKYLPELMKLVMHE